MTKCADCGAEVPDDVPGTARRPCPKCGSLARAHFASVHDTINVSDSVRATVDRGVNEARMGAFALIFATALGVGLTVGFATSLMYGVLAGIAAAAATALLLAAIYRLAAVRRLAMELMHRITGQ